LRFWFALLLTGGALVNAWEFLGEARVDRTELKEFPKQLGAWNNQTPTATRRRNHQSVESPDYLIRDYGEVISGSRVCISATSHST